VGARREEACRHVVEAAFVSGEEGAFRYRVAGICRRNIEAPDPVVSLAMAALLRRASGPFRTPAPVFDRSPRLSLP
jgi:hypothetical protein